MKKIIFTMLLLTACSPDPKPGEIYFYYLGNSDNPFENVKVYVDSVTAVKDGYVKFQHDIRGKKEYQYTHSMPTWMFLDDRKLFETTIIRKP